ncbi:major facilitator superfamily transporter [Thozetella sp. PMI_491]|nr:major facilitator superfamily transporter [Thozetella sp. PMI_491]
MGESTASGPGEGAPPPEARDAADAAAASPEKMLVTTSGSENDEKSSPQPQDTADDAEDVPESHRLNHLQLVTLSIALATNIFVLALDESIIATAIPRITDQFQSLSDVGWYGSGYLMTMACFQLTFGKLYKHLPSKWVLLSALTIFELGSAVCGASPSSNALIVGRVIAGIGASGIVSGVLIIISQVVPMRQRAVYTSSVASIYGLAAACGPLVGGALTDSYLTWRWCFYINLPLGGAVAAIIFFTYNPPPEKTERLDSVRELVAALDPLGLVLFTGAIICLVLALQTSGIDGWNSARPIALIVVFGVLLLAFSGVQMWLKEAGTLPPRIARMRQVIFSSLYAMTIDCCYYLVAYFLPIWFQAVKGTSAQTSGIQMLPLIISAVLASIVAGYLVSKTGHFSPFVIISAILAAIGGGLFTTLNPQSETGPWFGYQLLVGIGVGLGMQQGAVVVQNGLDSGDIPTAISVVTLFQALGSSVMVSVGQSVFAQRVYDQLHSIDPTLTRAAIINSGATEVIRSAPPGQTEAFVEAVNVALTQCFYVAAASASLCCFFSLGLGFKKLQQ